jgi:hypothetical protein
VKESHIIPSIACWIANKRGIAANGSRFLFLCARITEMIPITERPALAAKLAVAEKHIVQFLFFDVFSFRI